MAGTFSDPNNYVGQTGNGYVAIVNGQEVGGGPFASQQDAENAYNANGGPAPTSSGTSAPRTSTGSTYDTPNGPKSLAEITGEMHTAGWGGDFSDTATLLAAYNDLALKGKNGTVASAGQNLLDAIASGDTQKFQEAIREFNATLAQNKAEADQRNALGQQQLYGNVATNLLDTAAKLGGPADYYQYQQYLNGGKNLMQTLFGNQPMAAFQMPQGTLQPNNIQTLMQKMGFRTLPGGTTSPTGTTPTGGAPGQYYTKNGWKSTSDMLNELKDANWPQASQNPSESDIVAAYGNTTGGAVTPYQGAAA